jgi:hypothetical protein
MNLASLARGAHSFFFKAQPVTPVALFRIFFGLLVLQYALLQMPNLGPFYGIRGIVSEQAAFTYANSAKLNIFALLPPGTTIDAWLIPACWTLAVSAVFLSLGLFTRISTIIAYLIVLALQTRNPFIVHSGTMLIRLMLFYLIFSPAGEAYSLDRLLGKKLNLSAPPSLRAPWAQRLIQLQMALVYWHAFWPKISGDAWTNLSSVYFTSHLIEFQKFQIPPIFDNFAVCQALTLFTLLTEAALFSLVWFKEARYLVLLCGCLLHLGMYVTMNIPLFEEIMVCTYLTFIEPQDIDRLSFMLRNIWRTKSLTARELPGPT